MTFASPLYLLLLLLLPPLAYYLFALESGGEPALEYSRLAPLRGLADAAAARWRTIRRLFWLAGLCLLILALARPQQGLESGMRDILATDILLCLDVSESMRAEDFAPKTRIEVALEEAGKFVQKRRWDRIGLVLFGRMAMTQCPLTTDHDALFGLLKSVKIGMLPPDRTAIGDALGTCVERLKGSSARSKIIVLLTDGANNAGSIDPKTAADAAASFGVRIYAIGAGSPQGGYATIRDPVFGARRVRIADSLDEVTLTRVAEATGGKYFRAKDTRGLHAVFSEIDKLERTEIRVTEFTEYLERFEWFLLPGAFFFGAALLISGVLRRGVP